MKKKSALSIIGDCIFYLFIIAVIFLAIINLVGKKEGKHPTILGYSTYYILTGSMEPTIPVGSLVVVKNPSNEEIKANDIITFQGKESKMVTTHRVYKVLDGGKKFETKGDANNAVDPQPISRDEIVGVEVFHVPYVGKVFQFIQNNLVVVIAAIIGIFGVAVLIKNNSKK